MTMLTAVRQRSILASRLEGMSVIRRAIGLGAVLVVVCAIFWLASAADWFSCPIRLAVGARPPHQIYRG